MHSMTLAVRPFEGRDLTFLQHRGRPAVLVSQLESVLGYAPRASATASDRSGGRSCSRGSTTPSERGRNQGWTLAEPSNPGSNHG